MPKSADKIFSSFYDPEATSECLNLDFWQHIKHKDLEQEAYYHARKAASDPANPTSLLRLGAIYHWGIGTRRNPDLAHYFFKAAYDKGCEAAQEYMYQEYVVGTHDIHLDFLRDQELGRLPYGASWYKAILETARQHKHYALLAAMREFIPRFYPEYDTEQAIDDILNGEDTPNADIYFALSTDRNRSEHNHKSVDAFMRSLTAPIADDSLLSQHIKEVPPKLWFCEDEADFFKALIDYMKAYSELCEHDDSITEQHITSPNDISIFPYVSMQSLSMYRREIVRCLLSAINVAPIVRDEFLQHLDDSEELCNIAEKATDDDLQFLLINYVDIQLEIEIMQMRQQQLYNAYLDGKYERLCTYLNQHVQAFTQAGIPHNLPHFTPSNLPKLSIA